jgi:hypothetical protein
METARRRRRWLPALLRGRPSLCRRPPWWQRFQRSQSEASSLAFAPSAAAPAMPSSMSVPLVTSTSWPEPPGATSAQALKSSVMDSLGNYGGLWPRFIVGNSTVPRTSFNRRARAARTVDLRSLRWAIQRSNALIEARAFGAIASK